MDCLRGCRSTQIWPLPEVFRRIGRWMSADAGSGDPSHLKAIDLLPELVGMRPTDQSKSSLIRALLL